MRYMTAAVVSENQSTRGPYENIRSRKRCDMSECDIRNGFSFFVAWWSHISQPVIVFGIINVSTKNIINLYFFRGYADIEELFLMVICPNNLCMDCCCKLIPFYV